MVSFWGSLGASHMNECMGDFFRREDAEGYPFRHIHAVGKGEMCIRDREMTMIGITGTSGKTTSTYLIKSILEQKAGAKVGLIGIRR